MTDPTLVSALWALEAVFCYVINLSATDEESSVFSGFGCFIVVVSAICMALEEKINAKLTDAMAQEEEE